MKKWLHIRGLAPKVETDGLADLGHVKGTAIDAIEIEIENVIETGTEDVDQGQGIVNEAFHLPVETAKKVKANVGLDHDLGQNHISTEVANNSSSRNNNKEMAVQ